MTGPSDAKRGIISFYDIFGYFPQTVQGADILAYSNSENPSIVFMPDFLKGNTAQMAWFPPDTDEKKAASGAWMKDTLDAAGHSALFEETLQAATSAHPEITSWGVIGYCWGGKMVAMLAGRDTKVKAGVSTSPAMVEASDAEKIKVPMMMLASKDEPADAVKQFDEALKVTKRVETFGDQVHGWMSARADLNDDRVKSEYERGYKLAVDFFNAHL